MVTTGLIMSYFILQRWEIESTGSFPSPPFSLYSYIPPSIPPSFLSYIPSSIRPSFPLSLSLSVSLPFTSVHSCPSLLSLSTLFTPSLSLLFPSPFLFLLPPPSASCASCLGLGAEHYWPPHSRPGLLLPHVNPWSKSVSHTLYGIHAPHVFTYRQSFVQGFLEGGNKLCTCITRGHYGGYAPS